MLEIGWPASAKKGSSAGSEATGASLTLSTVSVKADSTRVAPPPASIALSVTV